MQRIVNINCDMAESFGAFQIGHDEALLAYVASSNVACGFHAGDPMVIGRFIASAKQAGVSIGAHPAFPDLQGFGRRRMHLPAQDIEYLVAYQIGALQGLAAQQNATVSHVKPHGALSNMAVEDRDIAFAIARAIAAVDGSLIFLVPFGSQMHWAAEALGLPMAREGFADRRYDDDGRLIARSNQDAVIRSPAAAAEQARRMVFDGEVISTRGKILKVEIESVCIHGDEPTAVKTAAQVHNVLMENGARIVALDEVVSNRHLEVCCSGSGMALPQNYRTRPSDTDLGLVR